MQRWEAGTTRPPINIQQRLARTPVPPIAWASAMGLVSIVEATREIAFLLDPLSKIHAASPEYRQAMQEQFGRDPIGLEFLQIAPASFKDLITREGGAAVMRKRGLSSLAGDYRRRAGEANGNRLETFGRVAYTALRLEGATFALVLSRDITAAEYRPGSIEVTYLDEILAGD